MSEPLIVLIKGRHRYQEEACGVIEQFFNLRYFIRVVDGSQDTRNLRLRLNRFDLGSDCFQRSETVISVNLRQRMLTTYEASS